MVVGVASRIVREAYRASGAGLVPKLFKEFGKYDVRIHRGLFGKAGGRGFRHGRDVGLALSSTIREESSLDGPSYQPQYSSRKQPKTRSRYGNKCRCRRNYKRSSSSNYTRYTRRS